MKKTLLALSLGLLIASPTFACDAGKHDGASLKTDKTQASASKKDKVAKVKTDKSQAKVKETSKKI